LLYDVFVHGSAQRPDEDGAADPASFYEVGEDEHQQDLEARALLRRTRAQLLKHGRQGCKAFAQKLRCGKERRLLWWFDMEDDNELEKLLQAAEEDYTQAQSRCPWQVLLSPHGDRLAILKEKVVCIRSDRTGFARDENEFLLPTRKEASSSNFASLSTLLTAVSALDEHPSLAQSARLDERILAWSLRSELLAVAFMDGEVCVFNRQGFRHKFTLEEAASPLPVAGVSMSSSGAESVETLIGTRVRPVGMCFREADCPYASATSEDSSPNPNAATSCPELLVLGANGVCYRVHIPVTAAQGSPHNCSGPSDPVPLAQPEEKSRFSSMLALLTPYRRRTSRANATLPVPNTDGPRHRRQTTLPSNISTPEPSSRGHMHRLSSPTPAFDQSGDRDAKKKDEDAKDPSVPRVRHDDFSFQAFRVSHPGHPAMITAGVVFTSLSYFVPADVVAVSSFHVRSSMAGRQDAAAGVDAKGDPDGAGAGAAQNVLHEHTVSLWRVLDRAPYFEYLTSTFEQPAAVARAASGRGWRAVRTVINTLTLRSAPSTREERWLRLAASLVTRGGFLGKVVFSPDGRRLAYLDCFGVLTLWNVSQISSVPASSPRETAEEVCMCLL